MTASEGPAADKGRVDFFVSYTGADVAWAESTATVLEAAGYTTLLQAWGFRPGSNFVLAMHDALGRCDRVMPLLTEATCARPSPPPSGGRPSLPTPRGRTGRLLPVRVGECRPGGLLAAVVYVDVVDADEPQARRVLLEGVGKGRRRPTAAPFPPASPAPFPGRLPPHLERGGPQPQLRRS